MHRSKSRLEGGPSNQAGKRRMADNGRAQFKAHEQTYGGFLGLLKYGAIAAFVVAAIVVFIVAS